MKSNFVVYVLAVVVLAIAAISFIWLPAMGGFSSVKAFASWDGREITNKPDSPFFSNMQYVQRMFETFGGKIPENASGQEYFQYQIANTAMTTSLVDLAMETEVEKCGYTPSEKLINLSLIEQFSDPSTGLYSQEAYDSTSEANKLKIYADVVKNLKRSRYIQDLLGSNGNYALKLSSKEASFIGSMNTEKRSIKYFSFLPTSYPSNKIKEYAEKHSDLFVKHDLSVISFQDEKAASTVSTEIINKNVNFDDAFKNQASTTSNPYVDSNGKLTNSYRKDLNMLFPNAEDLAKVIDLKVDEVSRPVKMNSLYVVLKCNALPKQPDLTDKVLLDEVFYYMRQYEKGLIEDYLVASANDFVKKAGETSVENACKVFKVEPNITESFAINYGNSKFLQGLPMSDSIISAGSANDEFFKTVFSLKESELSKPLLLNEVAVVVSLDKITSAEEEIIKQSSENYKNENQNWTNYYALSLITGQFPIPLAQSTVINFITENPKAKNNLYKFTN